LKADLQTTRARWTAAAERVGEVLRSEVTYDSSYAGSGLGGLQGFGLKGSPKAPSVEARTMTRAEWKAQYRADRIARGPAQSWSRGRKAEWTRLGERELANPSGQYSRANIRRMIEGRAARVQAEVRIRPSRRRPGGQEVVRDIPMELHHRSLPQRSGAGQAHESWNLEPVTPWAHEGVDPFRHTGYDLLRIIKGTNSY
jgi:hypothetical protein